MKAEGFLVEITLEEHTGLLKGGNKFNCGTWMDKMGSSSDPSHRNKGLPATPRDGAPIELVGLLYSGLCFMHQCYQKGYITSQTATLRSGINWTYEDWAEKVYLNFS